MSAVGIDFGTTNSVVAKYGSGPLEIDRAVDATWAAKGFGKVMPSILAVGDGDEMLLGWAAKLRPDLPDIEAVKRLLSTEETVDVAGRTLIIEQVVTTIFGQLKAGAASDGIDVDRAVVTVPANSRGPARYRTKLCAQMAGIGVLSLINEPTAAAMAFGMSASAGEQRILVFDFGGGTLDVTLLQAVDGVFMELASKGVGRLGGKDFDTRLLQKVCESVPDFEKWTAADKGRLKLAVEWAKIQLSELEETQVPLPNGEYRRVSRRMLEEVAAPLVRQALEPISIVLADKRMSPGDIDALVMVGGTSMVPAVRDAVMDAVGREPARGVNPMTAVAEGAAIAAAVLTGELTTNDFFVSTEHALGTMVFNPVEGPRFDAIIPRNHPIPAEKTENYRPLQDFQEAVNVIVMEGDAERPFDHPDNGPAIDERSVRILEPRPMTEISLDLTYKYDVDGVIHVSVRDVERDTILDEWTISSGLARDKREMVQIAGRASDSLEGGTLVSGPTQESDLDPKAQELLGRARTRVLPFLDEAQARVLNELCQALNTAEPAGREAAAEALEAELAKYAYLF